MSNKTLKELQQEIILNIQQGNKEKVQEILINEPKVKRNTLIILTMKKCVEIDKKICKEIKKQKKENKKNGRK